MSKETTKVFAGLVSLLANSAKEITELKREVSDIESQRYYDVRSLHDQLTYSKEALDGEMKEHDACKRECNALGCEVESLKLTLNKSTADLEEARHRITYLEQKLGEALSTIEDHNALSNAILIIQHEPINGVDSLPHPYKVTSDGIILHQGFWNGKPSKLMGFAEVNEQKIKVEVKEVFKKDVSIIRGLKPVFADANGDVYTVCNWVGYTYTIKKGGGE